MDSPSRSVQNETAVTDIIIANGTVITLGESNQVIEHGAVAISQGRIVEVGPSPSFAGKYPGAKFLDARGGFIMPGFINTHTHFYSAFARGMGIDNYAPKNFLDILEGLWWRLDNALTAEDVHYSAMVALLDCVRQGTTTVVDHHASPGAVDNSLEQIASAVLKSGLRACLCYEVSNRDGKTIARKGLAENERFIKKCRDGDEAYREHLAPAFGLHASFTVEDETLAEAAQIAANHEAPVHVHVAEGTVDNETSVKKFGRRPIARLDAVGLLNRTALLAHCIHLNEEEQARLAATPAWVLHNPQSNMNNAVGTAPIPHMMSQNIKVALGTDGITANMREELRVLGLTHKASSGDPTQLSFDQMYEILCRNNATLATTLFGGALPLGVLTTGAAADIVILDYTPPTPMSVENFMGHYYFGIINAPVRTTMVGGRVLMQDGKLLTLDEKEIAAKARELAPRVWQRLE